MISRRDNLLVRPWQQRRYDNHRRKVQSAAPAIDTSAPLPRQHVALKLKKKQKELERCQDIEKNNLNLLKRLSYVMRTNRVDNYWPSAQPNFLNRISLYDERLPKCERFSIDEPLRTTPEALSCRQLRCYACAPRQNPIIPVSDDRVPWESAKISTSKKRSQSVPPRKIEPTIQKAKVPKSAPTRDKGGFRGEIGVERKVGESQNIILSRGSLKLSVNFPSDSSVQLKQGNTEKVLIRDVCNCRNATSLNRRVGLSTH